MSATAVAELKTRREPTEQPEALPRDPRDLAEVNEAADKLAEVGNRLAEARKRLVVAKAAYTTAKAAAGSKNELREKALAVLDGGTVGDAKTIIDELRAAQQEVQVLEEANQVQYGRFRDAETKGWRTVRDGLKSEWTAIAKRAAEGARILLAAKRDAERLLRTVQYGSDWAPIASPYVDDNALGAYANDLEAFVKTGWGQVASGERST